MSASSLLSGTPAALSVDVDITNLNTDSATVAGLISATNTAGVTGATLTGAQNGGANVPRGVLTLVSNNAGVLSDSFFIAGSVANGLTIARDPLVGANAPLLTVDSANVTTIGDGVSATPLKVSGSDGIGIVYDTVNNVPPAVIDVINVPNNVINAVPYNGDAVLNLLTIPLPVATQSAKFYQVFLKLEIESSSGGLVTPDNRSIFITNNVVNTTDANSSNLIWKNVVSDATTSTNTTVEASVDSFFDTGLLIYAAPANAANLYVNINNTTTNSGTYTGNVSAIVVALS